MPSRKEPPPETELRNIDHRSRSFSINQIDVRLASILEGITHIYHDLYGSLDYQIHHLATDLLEFLTVSHEMVEVRALKVK